MTEGSILKSKLINLYGEDWRQEAPGALGTTLSTLDRQIGGYVAVQGPLSRLVDLLLDKHLKKQARARVGSLTREYAKEGREPISLEPLSDDARYVASRFGLIRGGGAIVVDTPEDLTERGNDAIQELLQEGIISRDDLASGATAYVPLKSCKKARTWVSKNPEAAFSMFKKEG